MLALYTRQSREWSELNLGDLGPMHRLVPEIAVTIVDETELDNGDRDAIKDPVSPRGRPANGRGEWIEPPTLRPPV